jgi:hypothetical protein
VPLRLAVTLPEAQRPAWALVSGDVLAGNNVGAATVGFDADRFEVTAEPQPSDA